VGSFDAEDLSADHKRCVASVLSSMEMIVGSPKRYKRAIVPATKRRRDGRQILGYTMRRLA